MIRILPANVANAIAAGEVVERPAAVVKELIENSLDAGAHKISITVRGAGRSLIQVVDDGQGIAPGELELAFAEHATSKLSSIEDLDRITSLGFRGEALPSIAAVSTVEATSSGRFIRIEQGKTTGGGAAGLVIGTTITVRDLFLNTPARLRFLKTEQTEKGLIVKQVMQYALLYPSVRFTLLIEGKENLSTSGSGEMDQAIEEVWGQGLAKEMLKVDFEENENYLHGLTSQPKLSKGSRDYMLLAINSRPISSRPLQFALEECYRSYLERGRYPVLVLDIQMDPTQVDVNVHPTKREVRLHAESAIFSLLQRALARALLNSSSPILGVSSPFPTLVEISNPSSPLIVTETTLEAIVPNGNQDHWVLGERQLEEKWEEKNESLQAVGQAFSGYLIAEGSAGLVLVDQHAAHERILYNRLKNRLHTRQFSSQPLLLPIVLELSALEIAALEEQRELLISLGYEIESFGPNTVRLLATPTESGTAGAEAALREIAQSLGNSKGDQAVHLAASSIACHAAVRFGDQLTRSEQQGLLNDLSASDDALTCPHGRPTKLLVPLSDLRRHFRRNY